MIDTKLNMSNMKLSKGIRKKELQNVLLFANTPHLGKHYLACLYLSLKFPCSNTRSGEYRSTISVFVTVDNAYGLFQAISLMKFKDQKRTLYQHVSIESMKNSI